MKYLETILHPQPWKSPGRLRRSPSIRSITILAPHADAQRSESFGERWLKVGKAMDNSFNVHSMPFFFPSPMGKQMNTWSASCRCAPFWLGGRHNHGCKTAMRCFLRATGGPYSQLTFSEPSSLPQLSRLKSWMVLSRTSDHEASSIHEDRFPSPTRWLAGLCCSFGTLHKHYRACCMIISCAAPIKRQQSSTTHVTDDSS